VSNRNQNRFSSLSSKNTTDVAKLVLSVHAQYGVAVLAALLGLAIMLLLNPIVPMMGSPFLLFFPAVMVSAWFGGMGPGLCTLFLSVLIIWYFFVPPIYSWAIPSLGDAIRISLYAAISVAICGLSASRREVVRALQIDINRRGRTEESLRATNQTLQALVHASPLAITVLDRQGLVKLWNPAAEQIFGWAREEVLERPLPTIPGHRWTEFQENMEATLKGNLLAGKETFRQRKDGSAVEIGLWTAVLRGVTTGDDRILCVMADVSDRKRAEAALQSSQERLMSLFDADIIGILFGDVEGGIDRANDHFLRMIGYTQEDLQNGNLDWVKITPPEYLPLDAERIAEAKERGACTPYAKEYIRQDGSRIPVLVGYTLIGEKRQNSVAFILDLTERKYLEEALRQQTEELARANRMKDEFLAVLSHELRTPLNSMLGWSRLLRTRQLDAATTERALETIERNARLQTQLIEDILDVSQIIRGKLRLHPRPVQLVPVMDSAIDSMRPAADAKGVQMVCEYAPDIGVVSGDPDRLQQVFWNLLSNAIKFTPEGGRVTVRLEGVREDREDKKVGEDREGFFISAPSPIPSTPPIPARPTSYAQITVSDTGKGISPDFLPFVFDRFRQGDGSLTRREGGLGLGLAIVRHLVELHGGSVRVGSPGLGQGSTFTVQLPLFETRVMAEGGDRRTGSSQKGNSQNGGTHNGNGTNGREYYALPETYPQEMLPERFVLPASCLLGLEILLVGDEAEVRIGLQTILESYGAIVRVASTAADAMRLMLPEVEKGRVSRWVPDVLISDTTFPGEDGSGLIHRLHDLYISREADIPALALVDSQRQNHEEALKAGFQMTLSKPLEETALVLAIARLTGRGGAVSLSA
jgi:PAS domain S-box-containing protein